MMDEEQKIYIGTCKEIIAQEGGCDGIHCDDCPFCEMLGFQEKCNLEFDSMEDRLECAKDWLRKNGVTNE